MISRLLFLLGALAPVVFATAVIWGGAASPGYSHLADAVSALTMDGAPTKELVGTLFAGSAALTLLLALAVWSRYPALPRRGLTTALLLLSYGCIAMVLATIVPMDPIGTALTVPGTLHLVLVFVSSLIIAAMVLEGGRLVVEARDAGPWFWRYSLASIAVMLVAAGATIASITLQVPLLGLFERLVHFAYQQWLLVFAILLAIRSDRASRPTVFA